MDTNSARRDILDSIRTNLAASVSYDQHEKAVHSETQPGKPLPDFVLPQEISIIELFKESLEAVDGKCIVVENQSDVGAAIKGIVNSLNNTSLRVYRVALSDSASVAPYISDLDELEAAIAVTPPVLDLFNFDLGISEVQAGIAETGTLVLEADREKNRLVSLVPPVHIAVLAATKIKQTLGETLSLLFRNGNVSQAITFISGPSRTADIELTLAIGVHGPQQLYVIVHKS